jgi:hypothetical protein
VVTAKIVAGHAVLIERIEVLVGLLVVRRRVGSCSMLHLVARR